MTWVRIESGFFRHRKVIDLPIAAKLLFLGGLCYAAENSTDGHISRSALRVLAAELDVKPVTTTLEHAGLWHKQADGWDIHDYLVYQPSAEQERQRRQEHADRMKQWRTSKNARTPEPEGPPRDSKRDSARDTSQPESQPPPRDDSRTTSVTLSPNPNPNPTTKSSSSEPLVDPMANSEEEDFAMAEARRRYRERQGPPVNNPEAWIARTANSIRHSDVPEPEAPRPITFQRPPCETCDGISLVVVDDGMAQCPDCTQRSEQA